MKPRLHPRPEAGLTLFEVGLVVAILMVVAVLLLPMLGRSHRISSRVGCVNNLKQIGLAYRIWEGDNGDIFPMGISVTNGGSKERALVGDAVLTYQVMSNELSTPKILFCPFDSRGSYGTNFFDLSKSNISYFVNVDVTNDEVPQMILSGDSNLELVGKPVRPGLASIGTNEPIRWDASRHGPSGSLGLVDGSAQMTTASGLRRYSIEGGQATNHLAIP